MKIKDDPWNPESPNYCVLPSPVRSDSGHKHCNAEYVVNGWVVGYCSKWVKTWGRKAGTHKGRHKIEWGE